MPKTAIRTMLLELRATVRETLESRTIAGKADAATRADCLQGEIENHVGALRPAFPDLDGALGAFLAAEPGQARDLARDVLAAHVAATRDHAHNLSRELLTAREATGVAQRAAAEHGARAGHLADSRRAILAELNMIRDGVEGSWRGMAEAEQAVDRVLTERDKLADRLAACQYDLTALRAAVGDHMDRLATAGEAPEGQAWGELRHGS